MLYKSVILCVRGGPTLAANTNNKEFPEKWKESFNININGNSYKGFCSD